MASHSHAQFKRGALVGGALGSILVALFTTRNGKQVREKARTYTEELYREIEKRAHTISDYTQAKYEALVDVLTDEYARERLWPVRLTNAVKIELKERWWTIQTYLLYRVLRERIATLSDINKREYYTLVDEIVETYASKLAVVDDVRRKLTKELRNHWDEIRNKHTPSS